MFLEKLTFDGFEYRTTKVNGAIEIIGPIARELKDKKNGTSVEFSNLSQEVIPLGSLFYWKIALFSVI